MYAFPPDPSIKGIIGMGMPQMYQTNQEILFAQKFSCFTKHTNARTSGITRPCTGINH